MSDELERCALPGCDATIEQPEAGGPRRLYCTAAHRNAARKQRSVARVDVEPARVEPSKVERPKVERPAVAAPAFASSDDDSAASAPTVSLSAAASSGPFGARAESKPAGLRKSQRKAVGALRRRKAVASLAIASLVAGGSGVVLSNVAVQASPDPLQQPAVTPQLAADTDQWASRADVVLASINMQLETVAQTEATWLQLPPERRTGQPPAPVQALLERKALLEQQRATVQSQLSALRSLPGATTDLTTAQAQLDAIERAVRATPTTSAQSDATQSLAAQRELRLQQRDHNVRELANLRGGVEQAIAAPLPDASDSTKPVVEEVLALVNNKPDDSKPDANSQPEAPVALPSRQDSPQERQDVSRTAPPDPQNRTPSLLASAGRDNGNNQKQKSSRSGGLVGTVGNTVGGALDGDNDSDSRSENTSYATSSDDDGDGSAWNDNDSRSDDDEESWHDDGKPVSDLLDGVGDLLGGKDKGSDFDDESPKPKSKSQRTKDKHADWSDDSDPKPSIAKGSKGNDPDDESHQSGDWSSHDESNDGDEGSGHDKPSGKAQRAKDRAAAEAVKEKAEEIQQELEKDKPDGDDTDTDNDDDDDDDDDDDNGGSDDGDHGDGGSDD